jgi:hypothetical protein
VAIGRCSVSIRATPENRPSRSRWIARPPSITFGDYAYGETRYRVLRTMDPEGARELGDAAQHDIDARWALYQTLANR